MANEKKETANKNQADNQPIRSLRENLARWLLIYPFLFVVGTIDFLIGCVVPFKYVEKLIPNQVVPEPPKHDSYPTPSGWVPINPEKSDKIRSDSRYLSDQISFFAH